MERGREGDGALFAGSWSFSFWTGESGQRRETRRDEVDADVWDCVLVSSFAWRLFVSVCVSTGCVSH